MTNRTKIVDAVKRRILNLLCRRQLCPNEQWISSILIAYRLSVSVEEEGEMAQMGHLRTDVDFNSEHEIHLKVWSYMHSRKEDHCNCCLLNVLPNFLEENADEKSLLKSKYGILIGMEPYCALILFLFTKMLCLMIIHISRVHRRFFMGYDFHRLKYRNVRPFKKRPKFQPNKYEAQPTNNKPNE